MYTSYPTYESFLDSSNIRKKNLTGTTRHVPPLFPISPQQLTDRLTTSIVVVRVSWTTPNLYRTGVVLNKTPNQGLDHHNPLPRKFSTNPVIQPNHRKNFLTQSILQGNSHPTIFHSNGENKTGQVYMEQEENKETVQNCVVFLESSSVV